MPLAIHHVPLCLTFAYFEKYVHHTIHDFFGSTVSEADYQPSSNP